MMPLYRKSNLNKILPLIFNKSKYYDLKLFDVSLRDGLQSQDKIHTLEEKTKILDNIIEKYSTKSIEIGSLVSEKVLPQLKNSLELYNYSINNYKNIDFFMLIPNLNYTKKALNLKIRNMSFITSVSNDFQIKNINKTLQKTKEELVSISKLIDNNIDNTKLYISCINKCPISGTINNDFIINEILFYSTIKNFHELCLSDTCGELDFNNFKIIIDSILNHVDNNKISLHLHTSNDLINLKKIIDYSIEKNIKKFDISILNSGGCSVTIKQNKLNNNLTYDTLFKLLEN